MESRDASAFKKVAEKPIAGMGPMTYRRPSARQHCRRCIRRKVRRRILAQTSLVLSWLQAHFDMFDTRCHIKTISPPLHHRVISNSTWPLWKRDSWDRRRPFCQRSRDSFPLRLPGRQFSNSALRGSDMGEPNKTRFYRMKTKWFHIINLGLSAAYNSKYKKNCLNNFFLNIFGPQFHMFDIWQFCLQFCATFLWIYYLVQFGIQVFVCSCIIVSNQHIDSHQSS